MFRKIKKAFSDLFKFPITYMPGGLGRKLRYFYYKNKFKKCGKNVRIDEGVIIQGAEWISVGDNTHIDKYCIIAAGKVDTKKNKSISYKILKNRHYIYEKGELYIGKNIHIAQNSIIMAYGGVYIGDESGLSSGVKLYSLTSLPNDPANKSKITTFGYFDNSSFLMSPVVIEENVGIALNSIILPGTTIRKNSFVGINSVVMRTFPENSYIAGDPAKRIKERFEKES